MTIFLPWAAILCKSGMATRGWVSGVWLMLHLLVQALLGSRPCPPRMDPGGRSVQDFRNRGVDGRGGGLLHGPAQAEAVLHLHHSDPWRRLEALVSVVFYPLH